MLAAEEKKDETLDELNKSTPKLNTMILVKNLQFNVLYLHILAIIFDFTYYRRSFRSMIFNILHHSSSFIEKIE